MSDYGDSYGSGSVGGTGGGLGMSDSQKSDYAGRSDYSGDSGSSGYGYGGYDAPTGGIGGNYGLAPAGAWSGSRSARDARDQGNASSGVYRESTINQDNLPEYGMSRSPLGKFYDAVKGFPFIGNSNLSLAFGYVAKQLGILDDATAPLNDAAIAQVAAYAQRNPGAVESMVTQAHDSGVDFGNPNVGTGSPTAGAAETPKAAGPMDDIFSQFAGGPTGFTMPTMPEYDADPSGMIAGAKGYMDDYNATYKPYAQKMMAEVDRYGSPEYQAQQRGKAMADVQQQYDNSMGQNTREMARMGVNPSSGRMAAMRNQGAIQSAAAKVNAAAKAEGMAKTAYMSGLGAVNSMGMDTAKMGQGWANMGNDAAKTKMGYGLGAAELGLKGQVAKSNDAQGWGKLSMDRYGIDKGVASKAASESAASDRATKDNQWTIGTAVLGGLFGSNPTNPY